MLKLPAQITLVGSENAAGTATRAMDGTLSLQTSPVLLPPEIGGTGPNQWYTQYFNNGPQKGIIKTGSFWTLYRFVNSLDGSNGDLVQNAVQYWANNSPDPSVGPYLPMGTSPDSGFIRVRCPYIALDRCGDARYNGVYAYAADHLYTKGGVLIGDVPYLETNSFGDFGSTLLLGNINIGTGVFSQDNPANTYYFSDTDPPSAPSCQANGGVSPQVPVASNYVSPKVLKGGSAASCRFFASTPLPGIPAPAPGCFSVWNGTVQTVADTPLPTSGVPLTVNGITYDFQFTNGSVTSATVQANLNALTLNFVGAQIFASGSTFTWSQFDIVRDPATRTNLTGQPPLVMAHYVLSGRDYGGSEPGYEQDVRDAMAAGIDGFALNCGSWDLAGDGGNYQYNAANMFQAAQKVSPDGAFKLFWSFDGMPTPAITTADFLQMMQTYWSHQNYWKVRKGTDLVDRAVVSTNTGNGNGLGVEAEIWDPLLGALTAANIPYFFMPDFPVSNTGKGLQADLLTQWHDVDGLFIFGVGGGAQGAGEGYAEGMDGSGKRFMSCLSPHYADEDNFHAYQETHGFESLHAQVLSVVNVQKPDYVECVTFNDFGENTHFSPIDDVARFWPYAEPAGDNFLGFMPCHRGYTRFLKFAIPWIKTGIEPTITQDTVLWAHRKHAWSAVASDPNTPAKPGYFASGLPPADEVYITTILTAPALVTVSSPNNGVSFSQIAPPGITHFRTPFAAGIDITPTFTLSRGGGVLCSAAGTTIAAVPRAINMGYATGFVEATPGALVNTPPEDYSFSVGVPVDEGGGYLRIPVMAVTAAGVPVDLSQQVGGIYVHPVSVCLTTTPGASTGSFQAGDWVIEDGALCARLQVAVAPGRYRAYVHVDGYILLAPGLVTIL